MSFIYDKAKEAFMKKTIDLTTDTIKAAMVTSGYTANQSADQFLSTVGANVVGTAQTLTSPTVTGKVFDAADVAFGNTSGSAVAAIILYKDTGVAGTSPLIAYLDAASISPLPFTPNGGAINIVWDNGTNKIFAL